MIARALVAQGAINHDEIWKLGGWGDLTSRGHADQQVTTAREKLLRYKNGKWSADRPPDDACHLCADCERIEFGVIAGPIFGKTRLTGRLQTTNNISVRVQDADWGDVYSRKPLLASRFAQECRGLKTDLTEGFLLSSNGGTANLTRRSA